MTAGARIAGAAWLAVVWVALWGDTSPGVVLAGVLVGLVVTLLLPESGPQQLAPLRPLAALRLAATIVALLLRATANVAYHVLTPATHQRPVITTVDLPPSSTLVAVLVANVISVTPGTLTLDLRRVPGGMRFVVHALDAPSHEAIGDEVRRLHELATAAFPGGPTGTEDRT